MDEPPSVPFSPRRPYFQHRATVSESGGKFAPTLTATPEPISPSAGSATLDGYPFASQPKPGANARSSIASSRSGSFDGLQIEIPRQFGEAGGYWNHYDHLADRHDRDMVRVLSDNLDSLLIFAGLFSSVNTALIVFTFDMLSPPNDAQTVALLKLIALGRTNLTANDFEPPPFTPTSVAVRVNCFFGASLACSLLASFGAVLAKQWVSHFARDHPGTLETQGRWRQRKLNGVARWHFQNVVETLPILLQIALVTFIAGVIDFLNSLNRVVTAIVTLFCAAGIVAYGVSVIVATLDPECPFQTPVSLFLHEAYIRCWDWGSDKWDRLRATLRRKRGVEPSGFGLANIMPTAIPLALGVAARDTLVRITTHTATTDVSEEQNEKREDREDPADEKVDDEIDNHTASWVVETSEHKEALLVTAKNIPALRTIKGTRLGQGGMAYVRLGSLFKEALTTWKTSAGHGWTTAQTVSALEGALIYGRALAHCSIGGPSVTSRPHTVSPPRIIWPKWRKSTINNDANELLLLRSCLVEEVPRDFCINHARDSFPQFSAALPIYLAGLMKPSTEKKRFRISASKLDRITLVQWLAHMSFANPDISSPTILNIGAWSLGKLPSMISGTDDSFTRELQDEWWHAYTSDKNLYKNVVQALNMYHYYQRLQSAFQSTKIQAQSDYSPFLRPEQYAELYTELLRAFRALIDTGAYHHEVLTAHMLELDGALRQLRLTVSRQSEGSQHENDERNPFDALEEAIGQTMDCLRKDAMEAMFPRATDGDADSIQDGGSLVPTFTEEYLTSRLRNSPTLSDAVVKALKKEHEGSRYAALAMIHDYAQKWFTDDKTDLHERFTQAGLVPTLRACMTNEENLPLVSGIIVQLMDSSLWARELIRSDLLRAFLGRGTEVLHVSQPRRGVRDTPRHRSPFRVLEYILDVWKVCNTHPDCESLANEWRRPEARQRLIRYIHSFSQLRDNEFRPLPPYVPDSFSAYIADINTRKIDDDSATNLNNAYTKLLRDADAAWWKLWDMPHPSTILRDRSGSLGISGSLDRT